MCQATHGTAVDGHVSTLDTFIIGPIGAILAWRGTSQLSICSVHVQGTSTLTIPERESESPPDLTAAWQTMRDLLLSQRNEQGWWTGELSTSALSTATAVMALQLAANAGSVSNAAQRYRRLVDRGLFWLADHQNGDGGWGDTILSVSNISTTMLANAVFHAAGQEARRFADHVARSQAFIDRAGGISALRARYGKDHTFSVPILTHCALAGTVGWNSVPPLPFELACVPARWYATMKLPVVSYALPALIAIGQVIFAHRRHWNPLIRATRAAAIKPSLKVLERIQPEHGGFLEATPLTSFVCMSLLGCGRIEHPVTQKCLQFIEASVRPDGSWPIDTNLTTWVTTLSINALAGDDADEPPDTQLPAIRLRDILNDEQRTTIRRWLLAQQYRTIHPYTNSPPGGWSWTDLPGGVPDADDTSGAMLALISLRLRGEKFSPEETEALQNAATWLLDLQNRNGGWPTFCRGWGTLPFDRSTCDLTAHAMRALAAWQTRVPDIPAGLCVRMTTAISRGVRFLESQQADDGSWLPLWFGNQHNENDDNPLYGTAKVLLALKDLQLLHGPVATKSVDWILNNQNDDGGWAGRKGLQSSTEETALAVEALAGIPAAEHAIQPGVAWLIDRVSDGTVTQPTPIGFYFAKLWYFETLYPIIFTTAALRRCLRPF